MCGFACRLMKKVILHTTVGPIDIELWSKETPKACRNFVQLCLEGFYDGTIFHRLIKGMCVQGGDPTGTGEGGQSIYGKPFRDEFHSRLRFVRRGLIAMASGGKDDNGSQFFFTLAATPHLNNKHTIFGKVAGDTLYNMLKLEDVDVDADDRPTFPQKIRRAEVIDNPFPDIEPRKSKDKEATDRLHEDRKRSKDKGKKDFKLLSFGDEAEEEEEELTEIVQKQFRGKSKSSHDLLKDDKTLSSQPAFIRELDSDDSSERDSSKVNKRQEGSKESASVERIREKIKEKSDRRHNTRETPEPDVNVDNYFEEERKQRARKEIEKTRNEFKKLKKEMKDNDRKRKEKAADRNATADQKEEKAAKAKFKETQEAAGDNDLLVSFFAEQAMYSKSTTARLKKTNKGDREAATLAKLELFKAKLHQQSTSATGANKRKHADNSSEADEDKNADEDDSNWMQHELRFEEQGPVLAKDATTQKEDMYDITDPRHPLNARKRKEHSHRRECRGGRDYKSGRR
ncbi:peptidyl-prolyl cis-trans isomerase CWC27 homolog isoform X2 [Varroa destructor]|uniref:Spliceosome-associated protein CWC27 homolog n=1 Tax=Varroa destructor TaxID=109461 RepID=A0A7M7KY47_VARDE|nr:peptidyl-prolyl cis-trans isomerase CWC27 homolog isoform X2 [Varroa destructor]